MPAAYGVPLVCEEVQDGGAAAAAVGVVSGAAAAEVPAVAEAASSAAASAGVVSVPRSGAVVADVNAAKRMSVRRAGLQKLLSTVKFTLPLVVAAVGASGFADLF